MAEDKKNQKNEPLRESTRNESLEKKSHVDFGEAVFSRTVTNTRPAPDQPSKGRIGKKKDD